MTSYIIPTESLVSTTAQYPSSDDPPASSEVIISVSGSDTILPLFSAASSKPTNSALGSTVLALHLPQLQEEPKRQIPLA